MAGAEILGRLSWLSGRVVEVVEENATARTIVFDCPGWPGHLPGQHLDMRLTAEDGYQAQRSYSIARPGDVDRVAITVELVANGEVSPYLVEEMLPGDEVELRGPIGGYFVWRPEQSEPLLLVGGGSGVVPLMCMVRAWRDDGMSAPVRLVVSARSEERLLYAEELSALGGIDGIDVVVTLTRSRPPGWEGPSRRVDAEMLTAAGFEPSDGTITYICGPTGFVESVATLLVGLGHSPEAVRTERFGPSGG